jgi:hypothetical protein
MTRQESWDINCNHALGETTSRFYAQIRDNANIYGRCCVSTGRVLMPPRSFSDQTLQPTTEWVEVGPNGRIETFTIVYDDLQNLPPRLTRLAMCCWTARITRWAATSWASI